MLAHERGPERVRRRQVRARGPPDDGLRHRHVQVLPLAGTDRVVPPAVDAGATPGRAPPRRPRGRRLHRPWGRERSRSYCRFSQSIMVAGRR